MVDIGACVTRERLVDCLLGLKDGYMRDRGDRLATRGRESARSSTKKESWYRRVRWKENVVADTQPDAGGGMNKRTRESDTTPAATSQSRKDAGGS